ncbi:MAG: peptidoglycan editing factor PgeF [Ruminococcaceae bacterium]|nr:peptidoglycan editing factor PgeF [Oscillospiraceae bacterium]
MFSLVKASNGVQFLRSDFIAAKHGFATRIGGVSTHPHTASLNLAFGRGDEDETVIENLRLFADAVKIPAESIISRPQIHSATVITVSESMGGEGYFVPSDEGCDGYVTGRPGIALGVKTADCVPILMEDSAAGVIGAVHAGWRGTASGIAAECVRKMCALGAAPANIRAAIGPAIHFCCYEVGEDFLESVAALVGNDTASRFIRLSGGRLHADIVGLNVDFLTGAGISPANIDRSDFCTCCHPELFYSHRFSGGLRGTMLSVISL